MAGCEANPNGALYKLVSRPNLNVRFFHAIRASRTEVV